MKMSLWGQPEIMDKANENSALNTNKNKEIVPIEKSNAGFL